jgi:methionine aminopeptidase
VPTTTAFISAIASQVSNIFSRYGVSNIRELLGHKVDLNFIETNPAVRLEKE